MPTPLAKSVESMKEDFNNVTRTMRIENRTAESVTKEWLAIDTLVQEKRPEFYEQPDRDSYRTMITTITQRRAAEAIPLIAISDLLVNAKDLTAVIKDVKVLKRRVPRPIEPSAKIKEQVLAILRNYPRLVKGVTKGCLMTNLQIIVNEIASKRINNYDFASYVERCRSIEEVRVMCGQAKSRTPQGASNPFGI